MPAIKSTKSGTRTHTRRSRYAAAALSFALIGAACGGDDTETATTTSAAEAAATTAAPTTTEAPATTAAGGGEATTTEAPATTEAPEPLSASFKGVTETEIHIGISMLDFEALKELSLSAQGWGDQISVYQSIVDDLNDRGGIHGRTVVPHFEFYSPLGVTEAEAACTALTKDVETFVVLGGFLGPAETANNCIVTINQTALIGGRQTAERLADAEAPWVDSATARERRLDVFLNILSQDGRLDGKNVAVIGSIEQEDIFNIAEDAFNRAGVEPVLMALNDVPQGDTVATDSRWAVISELVDASGADAVMLIGSTQGGIRGVAANGLDVEVWALESSGLENLGQETTPDDADGVITITGLTDQQQWSHESMASCRSVVEAAHPEVDWKDPDAHETGEEQWFKSVHLYCRNMSIFEQVATAAGRNPTYDTWQAAIDGIGKFAVPGLPFASLGPGKVDISDTFQLTQFDAAQGENGALVPIGDIRDGAA